MRRAPSSGTRARLWVRSAPWIAIVAAIAVVQVVRGQYLDATIFGAASVVLALDAGGLLRVGARPALPAALLVAVAAVVAVIVALAPRHGAVAGIAVALVGVAAVGFALLRPPARDSSSDDVRAIRVRRAAIGWAAVALVMCLVELWSFLMGRLTAEAKGQHPAVSELLDPALDDPLGKTIFAVAWVAVGTLLVTRGRRSTDA